MINVPLQDDIYISIDYCLNYCAGFMTYCLPEISEHFI